MIRKIFKPKYEKGQSLVELAISLTVLLFLLMGVVDLGRAFFAFSAMRDAAQEGAVYGSLYPGDMSAIEARTRSSSQTPVDMANTDIRVEPSVIGIPCHGNGIRIDIYYDNFPLLFPLWKPVFGFESVPIHARVEDTILRPPCK